MEMVDMAIASFWISGRKSRSVNNSSQHTSYILDLGNLATNVANGSVRILTSNLLGILGPHENLLPHGIKFYIAENIFTIIAPGPQPPSHLWLRTELKPKSIRILKCDSPGIWKSITNNTNVESACSHGCVFHVNN